MTAVEIPLLRRRAFGGVKEPGIEREASSYGIDEWLELEYRAVGM